MTLAPVISAPLKPITGALWGRGVAMAANGQQIPFRIVQPAKTLGNLETLGAEAKRWGKTRSKVMRLYNQKQVSKRLLERVLFVDGAFFYTVDQLRKGDDGVLVAQAGDGRVLGVVTAEVVTKNKNDHGGVIDYIYIGDLATDPERLDGVPGSVPLRGVGTALVAALAARVLDIAPKPEHWAHGPEIRLDTLDAEAAAFWKGRGFVQHVRLSHPWSVTGEQEIRELIGRCTLKQEARHDVVICGSAAWVSAYMVRN